ncbi:MAG TPA: amidohydrolase family protein [Planctomycetota bacterium]|nr:amidohydrolase family protein [Planctomycetota bacterium]
MKGRHYRTGKPVAVRAKDGRIAGLGAGGGRRLVGPGLVDLQVNGFRGLDFNTRPVPADLAGRVTRELWSEGVTAYLATVITNAPDGIEECVRAIDRGCESDADAQAGIAGIHLEGPFISPDDGPRGAHERAFVRPPDWDLFRRWQDASGGRIRLITLSPEWPEATAFIAKAVESGVIVSIGHTAGTPDQIRDAVKAGATMSTHLGNGAHLMLPRHPNYVWEQMAQDALSACVIADGFHLPDAVLKVILRAKGSRAMLVSDAVYIAGLAPGTYETHIGGKVVLTAEGKLHLAANPNLLAGSATMVIRGVEHLAARGLASLPDAWDMASTRPAAAIGHPAAKGLRTGAPADVLVLEARGEHLSVAETWKAGRRVYKS